MFFQFLAQSSCLCNSKQDGMNKIGIMCQKNGTFKKASLCRSDEICIGPFTEKNAVKGIKKLCQRGNILYHFPGILVIAINREKIPFDTLIFLSTKGYSAVSTTYCLYHAISAQNLTILGVGDTVCLMT